MSKTIILAITFCHFLWHPNLVETSQYERTLIGNLLKDYMPYERPVFDDSDPVNLKHGLTLLRLDLDVDKGVLTSNAWMNLEWNDANLKWNRSDYGGIQDIRLPSSRIWIPDIFPYNAQEYGNVDLHKQITDVVVKSSGGCTWIPPMVLKTICNINTDYSASSGWDCKIKVGSWTNNGLKLNLTLQGSEVDTSSYVVSKDWELLGTSAERHETYYECCPEPYIDITYTLKLRTRGYTLQTLGNTLKSLFH